MSRTGIIFLFIAFFGFGFTIYHTSVVLRDLAAIKKNIEEIMRTLKTIDWKKLEE